jgi:hypothetical protein
LEHFALNICYVCTYIYILTWTLWLFRCGQNSGT